MDSIDIIIIKCFVDRLAMGGAVDVVNKNGGNWGNTDVKLSTQINEMNEAKQDDVKWALEGDQVIPKSLNVLRMTKENFKKGFNFERVVRVVSFSPFVRYTALYTKDFVFSVTYMYFICILNKAVITTN